MATIHRRRYRTNDDIFTVKLHGTKITVTVTSTASVVKKWLKSTLHIHRYHHRHSALVVGLGVQWTSNAQPPQPADTLQLCIGRRCLIIHLTHAQRVPRLLRHFLLDRRVTFVGFWNHSDRSKLEDYWPNLQMWRKPDDLRKWVAMVYDDPELKKVPVRRIVRTCLGFEVEQSNEVSDSDWDGEYLSDDQVVFACVDAYCAFQIGKNIKVWSLDYC
ncbi:uncharacterized protein LOC130723687 [Lotus japonicus]|uniref:uncharacterized protein LOC130723687 n=1 Tax=Lotus japonicus TaxID=34305 RepID=UPI002583EFBD|nr:uncharacterized protein LOC130723687 [Lotus japonicus]